MAGHSRTASHFLDVPPDELLGWCSRLPVFDQIVAHALQLEDHRDEFFLEARELLEVADVVEVMVEYADLTVQDVQVFQFTEVADVERLEHAVGVDGVLVAGDALVLDLVRVLQVLGVRSRTG